MFTGLIERTGSILQLETAPDGARLWIDARGWETPLKIGESIAVNGICLSVVENQANTIQFDLLNETVQRTSLKTASAGDQVNLERAMKHGDRFGGHVVSGHIDGCACITAIESSGRDIQISVECGAEMMTSIVSKGSIALDGISLTVGEVRPDGFDVHIIPVTRDVTSLSEARVGALINVELDMLAKYVKKCLDEIGAAEGPVTSLEGFFDQVFCES